MVYLFIGQDSPSKDLLLQRLKQEFLAKGLEQFDLDLLYADELSLHGLQERLLCLPVAAKKRIIVIKDAQDLKEEIKEFLLGYAAKPQAQIILVLDIFRQNKRDGFINRIYRYAKVLRFTETSRPSAFTLADSINLGKAVYSLRIVNQLLLDGEKPERILGGLRYVWEKETLRAPETRKRLKLLLNCDRDIKTGKLKPVFALERLVISLCGPIPQRN